MKHMDHFFGNTALLHPFCFGLYAPFLNRPRLALKPTEHFHRFTL
jgi:hypothetical protein